MLPNPSDDSSSKTSPNFFNSPLPPFDIKEFSKVFDTDILRSISSEAWPKHSASIKKLETYAIKKRDESKHMLVLEGFDLVAYLLIHAAWAVHVKERKKGFEKASELLQLSTRFISPNNDLLNGYLNYVYSTVMRGNDEFEEAVFFADEAIGFFKKVPTTNSAIIHASIQRGLAALRLPKSDERREKAVDFYTAALDLCKKDIKSDATDCFDADRLLVDAEGDPRERALLNLTQYYLAQKNFPKALGFITELDSCSPTKIEIKTAYREMVRGECYLGLGNYDAALNCFFETCDIYTKEKMVINQNYLRAALGIIESCSELTKNGYNQFSLQEHYLEQAESIRVALKLAPDHDFSIRLDVLKKTCDHSDQSSKSLSL